MATEPAELLESPYALVGSVDHITEEILKRRQDFGATYFTWNEPEMEKMAPIVRRLAGSYVSPLNAIVSVKFAGSVAACGYAPTDDGAAIETARPTPGSLAACAAATGGAMNMVATNAATSSSALAARLRINFFQIDR